MNELRLVSFHLNYLSKCRGFGHNYLRETELKVFKNYLPWIFSGLIYDEYLKKEKKIHDMI